MQGKRLQTEDWTGSYFRDHERSLVCQSGDDRNGEVKIGAGILIS